MSSRRAVHLGSRSLLGLLASSGRHAVGAPQLTAALQLQNACASGLSHRMPWGMPSSQSFSTRRDSFSEQQYFIPLKPPSNMGVLIIPEQMAYVIERFGKFHGILYAGIHVLIPVVDRVGYVHSLKEMAIPISEQTSITKDNVTITIDGVLYIKVVDPAKASYRVDNAVYAVGQLAQTTMRSELGKISLEQTFAEREVLNISIVKSINEASEAWGLQCLRYEIRDISPPRGIVVAMELQAEAERRKRASILESEGLRQSKINVAEADKQQVILASEAAREETINRATGEAEAILRTSAATARGLELVGQSLQTKTGADAASLRVAEKYLEAFRELAKESTTMLLPSNTADPAAMVAQAVGIFKGATAHNERAALKRGDTATLASSPPANSAPATPQNTTASSAPAAPAPQAPNLSDSQLHLGLPQQGQPLSLDSPFFLRRTD